MNIDHEIQQIRLKLIDEDWISPKTEIRESAIGGKGLFALEKISQGDLVVVWGGAYVDEGAAKKAERDGFLIMQWDENLFSVEQRGDGSGYFVNHSCHPNLWLYSAYALVAIRDIEKNEELVADYAMWEADSTYASEWNCNCGASECRHVITGHDWRLHEIQEKYKGHFSPLINKRISQSYS